MAVPRSSPHRTVAFLSPGAGGMYCGSCLHDNALVTGLQRLGIDAVLVPLYTPLRTDAPSVSLPQIFLGGINVYLQQKSAIFRHAPRFVDRWLDHPALIRWVSGRGMETNAAQLADLTLSMLRGESGNQGKEFRRLVRWLGQSLQPGLVVFSNMLVAAAAPAIKRQLQIPVLVTLQGDDVFLEQLPPAQRQKAIAALRELSASVDGFLTHSSSYADQMADYLGLPRKLFFRVPLGLPDAAGDGAPPGTPEPAATARRPPTIGYLARLAPEKGLHLLVQAMQLVRQSAAGQNAVLHIAGWQGGPYREYAQATLAHAAATLGNQHVVYAGELDGPGKVNFLKSLDLFSVPCTYREPKGLYVLEALAAGVPFVQPNHGIFPELLAATGGGLLFEPQNVGQLSRSLVRLLEDEPLRRQLGAAGQQAVRDRFSVESVARGTWAVYQRFLSRP